MIAQNKGDVAEFLFDVVALSKGLIVNRPIHYGTVYDRVVYRHKFFKVQIKSIMQSEFRKGGVAVYRFNLRRAKNNAYTDTEVDVFCVYLQDADKWVIIPYDKHRPTMRCSLDELKDFIDNWEIFETL